MLRSRTLTLTVALAFFAVAALPARSGFAQPAPAEVKSHMDAAERAARAKDWDKAAAEYKAAFELTRGAVALDGMANALYELKRSAEAFEAYDELLRNYGDAIGKRNKTMAEARHKELAAQTGTIQVRVAESGAEVSIDGKAIGASPVPPRHVTVGPHAVRVTKPGFAPFEQTSNVAAGGATTIDATLVRESSKGRVVVKEKDDKPMRVVVDGLDVGAAPWEGDLDPGPHEILVRSSQGASTPQRVEVERGKTVTVELAALASTAHLEVKTSESGAILFFDGKPLAEGNFSGDVAPGEHTLVVTREGFQRFEKKLTLSPNAREMVEVKLQKPGESNAVSLAAADVSGRGFYGGFAFAGIGVPGGSGNDIETRCTELGAVSCSTPMPLGGGVFGYFGYSFAPVGFELFLGGEFDQAVHKAVFSGDSGGRPANPAATGVPRVEEFTFIRSGGLAAIRARVSAEGETVRASFAAGFGFAYKMMLLTDRTATSTDGKNLKDVYTPKAQAYASPALTLDASVQWRVGRPTALTLGVLGWLESASFTDVRVPGDLNRYMGAEGQRPAPISTPTYVLARDAQLFVGPYLGMQFGP